MEIRDLAERVLFGDTLKEKLIRVEGLTDEDPGQAQATPDAPGRPVELGLDRWSESERVTFPDVRSLEREQERGLVLHFFANHELLAAELMALVLLKFPDAPAKFRRGVAQTLRDEQEHVRLYLARMQLAGVEFGQIPVSDFFWRAIAPMPTPMDFVARLSLTLEQANLDYAPHYQRLFADLGDGDTAALMGRIYRDEIGHVKHGLNWFNTWRSPTQSEWESFQQALAFPLSPSRAKGIGFNRQGRLLAGLPAEFIDELEVFARSHGRCPYLYWFNPVCDLTAGRGADFTPTAAVRDLAHDLAMVPAMLAAADDIVVVPKRPSVAFLQRLKSAGLPVPELVEWDAAAAPMPPTLSRRLTGLRPWGWSPDSVGALQPLAAQLPAGTPAPAALWTQARRQLYSKSWSSQWLAQIIGDLRSQEGDGWLCDAAVVGTTCEDEAGALQTLGQLFAAGWERVGVKAAFGAAGGQQMVAQKAELPQHQQRWLVRTLQEVGAVVVEPWLDRVLDLSAQYEVDEDGSIRHLGTTRFLADDRGRFQGVFVHDLVAGLDADSKRLLYGDGRDGRRLQRLFGRLGELIHPRLPEGFCGAFGIDAFVYRAADTTLRLKPIVEVNPRYTMGRIGLALGRRVLAARTAVWRIVRVKDLIDAGYPSAEAWAQALQLRMPLVMTPDGRQISSGAICTNDPLAARAFIGVLSVGESLDDLDLVLTGNHVL